MEGKGPDATAAADQQKQSCGRDRKIHFKQLQQERQQQVQAPAGDAHGCTRRCEEEEEGGDEEGEKKAAEEERVNGGDDDDDDYRHGHGDDDDRDDTLTRAPIGGRAGKRTSGRASERAGGQAGERAGRQAGPPGI
ncbi:unnamed protein product [Lampetra planeri]